jgi:asparagine synthetase B (glutamine-hydrolysing)
MLLKIQTSPFPSIDIVQQDDYCSVYRTDVLDVFLVGQIFNDLSACQNPAHFFYENVVKQPVQKVDEIDGYYGVVILDKSTASVRVFRDPIGMQPLYYALHNNDYLFSTTLKAIKDALPDAAHCEEFFLKYLEEIVPNTYELTMYEGILRIAPNSQYVFKDGQIAQKCQLFDFESIAIQDRTDDEAIRMFQEKLEKAVGNCSKGHNDLFFQYTGGLDSTGILAVSRFLNGSTEGFHTYIHQYFPDHESFDEMHIVKKLHQTEGLPLPHYTPETHFDTLEAEVAYGQAHHTLMIINQVLDAIYVDINSKKGKLLFSGFGGDEGVTFNESPRFLINQLRDLRFDKMLRSIQVYGMKRYIAQLIKIDLQVFLLKLIFPRKTISTRFNYRKVESLSGPYRRGYDTHGYIRYMLALPRIAYRIEEEKEAAALYGVTLAYPWLDFQLLCYFLSLKENQLIYKKRGRLFYKNALRKYIQSDWYFNYRKAESVTVAEPMNRNESELDAQLLSQYDKLPHFVRQYNFRDTLPKQHQLVKEILLGRLSKLSVWLSKQ